MNQSTSRRPYSDLEMIETVFAHMAAIYGNRFNDLWRGINPDDVKAVWAQKLSEFESFDIKFALDGLLNVDRPPNLPEFYAMCRQGRAKRIKNTPQLPSNEKPSTYSYTPEEIREKLKPYMKKIIVQDGAD